MVAIKKIITDHWLTALLLIIVALRFIATSDRNILALNMPHDDYWYIRTAIDKIWHGTYNQMSSIHLPVYSAWLDFTHVIGVRSRLAIDVGWMISIGYLSFAIYRLTRINWLASLLFIFLAFHPYTLVIFDRSLAETFLAVVSAAVIGAAIELWNCRDGEYLFRRRIALVVYVVGFGVAFHTRKEGVVLVVPVLILFIWSLIDRQHWWSGYGMRRLAIPLLLAPVLSMLFLGLILIGGNFFSSGILARYELAAPGYQRAISALNSIDIGRTPRHFTVTKDVLSLAYQESPTFRELQPFMEATTGQMWISISAQNTGVPNEIGNGWFYWALRDVAAQAGWHKNATFADSKYEAAAKELENAFSTGRLKRKEILISSFIDPDIGKWLPEVPFSVFKVVQLVVRPQLQDLELPKENASESQLNQYLLITGRRVQSSGPSVIVGVTGWAAAPKGTIVSLGTSDKTFSLMRLTGQQRADVPGAYPFSIASDGIAIPTELNIVSLDGRKGSIAVSALKAQVASSTAGSIHTEVGVDSLTYSKILRIDRWLSIFCVVYEWLGYALCFVTMAAIYLLIKRREYNSELFLLLVLIFVEIAARVALFGIIDASSFNAIQARYMLPAIPFFACMGAVGIAIFIRIYSENKCVN